MNKPKIPLDYADSQGQVPRAERRDPEGAVLICISVFAIAGGIVGAVAMWLFSGGC